MKLWLYSSFFCICLLFTIFAAEQGESDPAAIMARATLMGKAPSLFMNIEMEIHTEQGTKDRTLEVYYQQDEEATKTLIQIVKPAFLRKMKFLTHAFNDGSRTRWLKTSTGLRRLSSADSGDNLFDSDFTVEDLSEFELDQFVLTWLRQEQYSEQLCDVVLAVPDESNSSYSKKIFYVDIENSIIRGVDFFDADANIIKQYHLLQTKTVTGQIFPGRCEMVSLEKKTSTIIIFDMIDTTRKIAARFFNKGNL